MAGRGVDILLGGNPEGLAAAEPAPTRPRLDPAVDLDPTEPNVVAQFEADAELAEAIRRPMSMLEEQKARLDADCKAEGDDVRGRRAVRAGTERHESRRIDNQLRGRSGRQGDPGESRFYLSLEDELMRLFATGAMNWVMGKALPDDVPIEAKMVTKAIERAQTTVEARNAEIRKNVLKYDEVMNEQRKVIYAKRRADPRRWRPARAAAGDVSTRPIDRHRRPSTARATSSGEWDIDGLHQRDAGYTRPSSTVDDLPRGGRRRRSDRPTSSPRRPRATRRKRSELGAEAIREIERNILLRCIDQRWREHLADMDYLRRASTCGPWARRIRSSSGSARVSRCSRHARTGIDDDFVRYAMHAEVVVEPAQRPVSEDCSFVGRPERIGGSSSADVGALFAGTAAPPAAPAAGSRRRPVVQRSSRRPSRSLSTPIVKSDDEKIGRNEPCHCGSGKKFKNCHGKR